MVKKENELMNLRAFNEIDYESESESDDEKKEFNLNNIVDSATWNFGDPASGVNNVTTGVNVKHVFSAPGVYTVTTTATLGTEVSTINTEVVFYQNPTVTQPTNLMVCDSDNDGFFNFNLKKLDASILNWGRLYFSAQFFLIGQIFWCLGTRPKSL